MANDKGVDPVSMFYDFYSAHGGTVDDANASDGSFVYTPPPDFSGIDSFGYQIDDLNGDNTYYGTVYIHVGGPTPPTSVTATGGNHQAQVAFSGATTSGAAPITSYTATASPGGQTVTGSASPLVVTGLTDGTTYNFTVHSSSTDGSSIESAPSNAVIPTGPPTATTFIAEHRSFNCDIRSRANNRIVSGELGYAGSLNGVLRARSTSVGTWEKFQCVAVGANQWALRSRANGKFVSAELHYAGSLYGTLRARSTTVGTWEKDTITMVGACTSCFALRSGGERRLRVRRTGIHGLALRDAARPVTFRRHLGDVHHHGGYDLDACLLARVFPPRRATLTQHSVKRWASSAAFVAQPGLGPTPNVEGRRVSKASHGPRIMSRRGAVSPRLTRDALTRGEARPTA